MATVSDIRAHVSLINNHKRAKFIKWLAGRTDSTPGKGAMDYLMDLWLSVAMQRPNGVLTGWDSETIEHYAGWEGDKNALFNFLLQIGFIDSTNDDGYIVHDWADHQPYVSTAEHRSNKARKAAFIKNHGKDEGTKLYKQYIKKKDTTAEEPEEDLAENEPDMTAENADTESLIKEYEGSTTILKPKQRTMAIDNINYWLKHYSIEELNRAIKNYIAASVNTPKNYRKFCNNFFAISGDDVGFFKSYLGTNHYADVLQNTEKIKFADMCCKKYIPNGNCGNIRGSQTYCSVCEARSGAILTPEEIQLLKQRKMGVANVKC